MATRLGATIRSGGGVQGVVLPQGPAPRHARSSCQRHGIATARTASCSGAPGRDPATETKGHSEDAGALPSSPMANARVHAELGWLSSPHVGGPGGCFVLRGTRRSDDGARQPGPGLSLQLLCKTSRVWRRLETGKRSAKGRREGNLFAIWAGKEHAALSAGPGRDLGNACGEGRSAGADQGATHSPYASSWQPNASGKPTAGHDEGKATGFAVQRPDVEGYTVSTHGGSIERPRLLALDRAHLHELVTFTAVLLDGVPPTRLAQDSLTFQEAALSALERQVQDAS